jgi:hypothetical protein
VRGEIGLGHGVQTPDDVRLHGVSGLIFDANATWRPTELTSLLLEARSGISETTTANVGLAFAQSVGVEVRHQLRRYVVASAGLAYSTQNSQDGVIDDRQWLANLGLEYYVNREAVLFATYVHTKYNAIGTLSDYQSDEMHVGIRFRR